MFKVLITALPMIIGLIGGVITGDYENWVGIGSIYTGVIAMVITIMNFITTKN